MQSDLDDEPQVSSAPALPVSARFVAAWIITAAYLLMVTKGPVFRIRFEAAPVTGDFIDDRWVQGAFLAGALLVIAVCAPAVRRLDHDPVLLGAMAAVVGLVMLSGLWSVDPARTIEQGIMMTAGTVAALLAGATLGRLGLVTALATAVHIGVLASLFAWWRDWFLVVDRNGDLAGIYFNRNSLGPVALMAAATALVLAIVAFGRGQRVVAAALAAIALVDLWVWWASGSLTPVFGLLVAIAVLVVFVLALPGPQQRLRRRIALVIGSAMGIIAVAAVAARGVIATRLDRSPTLSGRTEIWEVVLQFVGQRPIHGHGFMAAWLATDIVDELTAQYGREVYEAHSGFLEMLLGVGIIGLVALMIAMGAALHRTGSAMWVRPDALGLFLFAVAVYAVAVNLGETYVGANLLPWTLLVAISGIAAAELAPTRPPLVTDPAIPGGPIVDRPVPDARILDGHLPEGDSTP